VKNTTTKPLKTKNNNNNMPGLKKLMLPPTIILTLILIYSCNKTDMGEVRMVTVSDTGAVVKHKRNTGVVRFKWRKQRRKRSKR
jgi:hypothetical protein